MIGSSHPWHQIDQCWSIFVEWITKNSIFYWFWHLFCQRLLRPADVTFFRTSFKKLKCPHLLKPLGTIIQQNYWSFYPPEPFSFVHFNMIQPVVSTTIKDLNSNSAFYCMQNPLNLMCIFLHTSFREKKNVLAWIWTHNHPIRSLRSRFCER